MNISTIDNSVTGISMRNVAMVAGVAILLMAVAAGFSYGVVLNGLMVPGDAATTAQNIKSSEFLFRAGVLGWLLILILDVIVAWVLYTFFRKENKSVSLLTALFRLGYTFFLGIALFSLVMVLLLLSDAAYLQVLESSQPDALVLLFLNAFNGIWSLGLVIFGLHLAGLAYLVLQSAQVPNFLGILLALAAVGYLFIPIAKLLLPGYASDVASLEAVMSVPMAIGEAGFGLWLLIKGGKVPND
jgi:hypothetical protein